MKIVIVGAGASGLCCAYYLVQKGHKHIKIIESHDHVGGKINSFEIDDNIYEYGAIHLLNYYKTTYELLEKFGIPIKPVTDYHLVINESIKKLFEFIEGSINIIMDLDKYYEITKKYNEFLTTANFKDVPIDIRGSLHDYLTKNNLSSLIPFLEMMSMRLTSIPAKELSFAIFIKVFPPNMLREFINYNIPIIGKDIAKPPIHFIPEGYDSLMKKMADYLIKAGVKIKFGKTIKSINKNKVITHTKTYKFDRLIMTSLTRNFAITPEYIEGLPIADLLKGASIKNPCVFKQHVKCHDVKYGDFILIESAINQPYSVYNFYEGTKILGTLTNVDTTDREIIRANIVQYLKGKFGEIEIIEQDKGYFCFLQPIVSVKDIEEGFFDKLEAFQGKNNIYYSNIFFTTSYSGLVMQYAREMIATHF